MGSGMSFVAKSHYKLPQLINGSSYSDCGWAVRLYARGDASLLNK